MESKKAEETTHVVMSGSFPEANIHHGANNVQVRQQELHDREAAVVAAMKKAANSSRPMSSHGYTVTMPSPAAQIHQVPRLTTVSEFSALGLSTTHFGVLCDANQSHQSHQSHQQQQPVAAHQQQIYSYADANFPLAHQTRVKQDKGEAGTLALSRTQCGNDVPPRDPYSTLLREQRDKDHAVSAASSTSPPTASRKKTGISHRGIGLQSSPSANAFQDNVHRNAVPMTAVRNHQGSLLYQTSGGDAMLSAINYNENEILQEGGFDVGMPSHLENLDDGLLGRMSVGTNSVTSNSAYDLFDGDGAHNSYMGEPNTELTLSPHPFGNADDFSLNDNSNLSGVNDTGQDGTSTAVTTASLEDVKQQQSEVHVSPNGPKMTLQSDKTKGKNRPLKATSPSRQGAQTCPVCGKVFGNCSALAKHKLTHSDERKYVCQMCAKAFKRQDHLNGHLLTHMNKKPYECKVEGCGKSYCDARSLRRHTEHHHNTTLASSASSSSSPSSSSTTPGVGPQSVAVAITSSTSAPVSAPTVSVAAASLPTLVSMMSPAAIISNCIQYAPRHPALAYSAASVAAMASRDSNLDSSSSAASQLQLLALQQHETSQQVGTVTLNPLEGTAVMDAAAGANMIPWQQSLGMGGGRMYVKQEMLPSNTVVNQNVQESGARNKHLDNSSEYLSGSSANVASSCTSSVLAMHLQRQMQMNQQMNLELTDDRRIKQEPTDEEYCTNQGIIVSEMLSNMRTNQMAEEINKLPKSWPTVAQTTQFPGASASFVPETKPVECTICQRKFKNIPALNGHMRLHGGYFKKESEIGKKKSDGEGNQVPLQTVSVDIRARIEEKIIQRRIGNPTIASVHHQNEMLDRSTFADLEEDQDQGGLDMMGGNTCDMDPFSPPTHHMTQSADDVNTTSEDQRRIEEIKRTLMSHQPIFEKFRRHSDSDHFIAPKRPTYASASSTLMDLLRRTVTCKRTQRTGSDPGESDFCGGSSLQREHPQSSFSALEALDDTSARQMTQDNEMHVSQSPPVVENSTFSWTNAIGGYETPPVDSQPGYADMVEPRNDVSGSPFSPIDVAENLENSSHNPLGSPARSPSLPLEAEPAEVEQQTVEMPRTSLAVEKEDDDVFLSPSPSSPMVRAKKKHRPEPLHIPPQVNACGFQSRLRSPRLWDPSIDGNASSPPPYTPPPMLSPVRCGSGLFWHMISGSGSMTPKSAPLTPRFSLTRQGSLGEMAVVPEDDELGSAPATDILPKVNIGAHYQAQLPVYDPRGYCDNRRLDDMLWDNKLIDSLTDKELDMYLEFACCAAVPGGGRNKEYALHVLFMCNGNLQDAMLALMNPNPRLAKGHHLLNYQYAESDKWTPDDIDAYQQALFKFDKDFFSVAQEMSSKNVKQCVQFYYLWKKICPEEYKKLRVLRRRREQDNGICNLRSRPESINEPDEAEAQASQSTEEMTESPGKMEEPIERFLCNYPHCSARFVSRQALNSHIKIHASGHPVSRVAQVNGSRSRSPFEDNDRQSSPCTNSLAAKVASEPLEEFPCKYCGKVFGKVKSRSAHMKSHRSDADRR